MLSIPKIKYLIDTNIYGLSFRTQYPHLKKFLGTLDVTDYDVSCFVLAELEALRYSYVNKDFGDLINTLNNSEIAWFGSQEIQVFGYLKHIMSTKKLHNRTIDWFIATQCLSGNYTLVTANIKDFENIPNLKTKFYDQKNCRWL
jgi:predicted nucleic acid-binding protein